MLSRHLTLLCAGLALAVALIYIGVQLARRVRVSADESVSHDGPDWKRSSTGRVLWDVADRMRKPVVRDGVLYIDRRGAIARGFSSILALVGIVAVGRPAGAVTDLLQGDDERRIAHFDVPSTHNDSPHNDNTPHSDGGDGKGGHIDEHYAHQDSNHVDNNNPHTDNPRG